MKGRAIFLLAVSLLSTTSIGISTDNVTWYQGCYETRNNRRHFPVVGGLISVSECAMHCEKYGYNYTFVQTTSGQFQCGCAQSMVSMETADCCDTRNTDRLQIGLMPGCWGVYGTLGPYLTMVAIEIDRPVVVVNESVTLEIFAKRASSYNISKVRQNDALCGNGLYCPEFDQFPRFGFILADTFGAGTGCSQEAESREISTSYDAYTGHHLDILWKLRHDNHVHHETTVFQDYTEVYHRPYYTFTETGHHTIDVKVSNDISILESSIDLEVVYPEPRHLQLGLSDGLSDLPACIPKKYNIQENSSSTLVVFINTTVELEASVSMGTNLTFTFTFGDSNEVETIQLEGSNTSISQKHVFQDAGRFVVMATAENKYGQQSKNITVIVVSRRLSDLSIDLDPRSGSIATTDTPLWYTISMVTTSRDNLYLLVWYGDGRNNFVSLSDTDGPALILSGNGKDMEIVADYGDGCELMVEFSYLYAVEGLFKPRVAIFDSIEHLNLASGSNSDLMDNKRNSMQDIQHKSDQSSFQDFQSEQVTDSMQGIQIEHESLPYFIDELPFDISEGIVDENSRSNRVSKFSEDIGGLEPEYAVEGLQENPLEIDDSFKEVENKLDNSNGSSDSVELLAAELEQEVLILKKLENARIHGPSIVPCDDQKEFVLQVLSKFNVSVNWKVYLLFESSLDEGNVTVGDDEKFDYFYQLVFERSDNLFAMNYTFVGVGQYLVIANVANALSSTVTKLSVNVMCPVQGLLASCDKEYIQTGLELTCYAEAKKGSDLSFEWIIDGYNIEKQLRLTGNYSSILKYKFVEADICDISVTAMNNISSENVIVESAIRVQDPITDFTVHRNIWVILGQRTKIIAHYKPTSIYNQYCYFGFDYGNGEIHKYTGIVNEAIGCYYIDENSQFPKLGKYFVKVYAYNRVSNMSKVVEFWVIPSLENVSIELINTPTLENPARFLVKDQGKAMETENVYFSWMFGGDSVFYSNSPLIEVSVLNDVGEYILYLNLTTPEENEVIPVTFNVSSRSEVNLLLLHDLYVAVGNKTEFVLKGPLIGWSHLVVNYSDGTSETYQGVTYRWNHTFLSTGIQRIKAILVGAQGAPIEVVTSLLMIEEPIRNISLQGPSLVRVNDRIGYSPIKWTALIDGGTNILYRWTLEDTIITTLPEFEVEIETPGIYSIYVEAWNDVSPHLYTEKQFRVEQVEHPIEAADLTIIGDIVGEETKILISIAGHQPFSLNISFGDRNQLELSTTDLSEIMTSLSDSRFVVTIGYVYGEPGEYNITVDVFNSVSCVAASELFVPIVNVSLVTQSPWLLEAPGFVKVRGQVEGGADLTFTWNFQNDFEETIMKSYDNQTSIATQRYDMPGEYQVSFNVTGRHYPLPGISVTLDRPFLVVDPINTVILDVVKNSVELVGNSTSPVNFHVKSSGSHVSFLFEFGDGYQSTVTGSELSVRHVYMTMRAEARHTYHEEGKFEVKVTAINPLGNLTEYLASPFYVQKPPRNLYFCQPEVSNLGVKQYAGHVGQDIKMCANVTMGTNVTFDWKLGDQNDMVKHGSLISHRYSTPGIRTVFVTAKNKVNKVEKSIQVFVNYKLQGVQLIPSKTIVALGDSVKYTAVVRPDYNNTARDFIWKFMFPSKSMGRERRGEKTINSERNTIYFSFKEESGICLAKVTAKNAINRVDSGTVEIHVIDKIQQLEIILHGSKYERLVNKTIRFHSFHFAGTNVTYTWDFGDGSAPVVTTKPDVNKTFHVQNGYNISLTASNPVSSQTVSLMLFIMEKSYCNEPVVNIINQPDFKIQYSKHFTLEASVVTDCNLTTMVQYRWLIDGRERRGLEMNKRVLVLPPRTLSYGIHSVQFWVKMNNTIVYAVKEIQIEVVQSPLTAGIKGGIFRRINPSQTVVLDGTDSLDPDVQKNVTLSYIWNCLHVTESGNQGKKCFIDDIESSSNQSCNVSMETPMLVFPGECLVEASNFTFNLTVYADNRQSSSVYQVLSVTKEIILDVKIVRPSLVDPVNADRKLSFYGECGNCPPGTKYSWGLKQIFNLNSFTLVRAHDLECVEANGTTYYQILKQEEEDRMKQEEIAETDLGNQRSLDRGTITTATEDETQYTYDGTDTSWTVEQGVNPDLLDDIVEGDVSSDIVNRRRRSIRKGNNSRKDVIIKSDKSSVLLNRPRRSVGAKFKSYKRKPWVESGSARWKAIRNKQEQLSVTEGRNDLKKKYRRSVVGESTTFSYPTILAEGDPGSRTIKYPPSSQFDISENVDTNPALRIPTYEAEFSMREGSPGESGSSGARQYGGGYPPITERVGNARNQNGNRGEDSVLGSGADDRNRLETIKRNPDHMYTILDQRPAPVYLLEDQTKTGLYSESLVIKPGVLKQGLTYIVELSVFNEELGLEGLAKSSFEVNESPVEGRCSIQPQSGVELDTEFTLLCKEWRDQHRPFMYEIGYRLDEATDKILIYRGVNNYFTFKLPAGREENNYNVFVSIDILDSLLAKTSVCSIAIDVKPKRYHSLDKSQRGILQDTNFIYHEVTDKNSSLQKSKEKGDDAMSKVYISYLATKLNKVTETDRNDEIVTEHNGTGDNQNVVVTKQQLTDVEIRVKTRTELLKTLRDLPVRDEAEILQTAQALAFTTAIPDELCSESLDISLVILKSIINEAEYVYGYDEITPTGNLVPVVVQSAASIITATRDVGHEADEDSETFLKNMITRAIQFVENLVLNELKFHMISEDPISASTDFLSVLAMRHATMHDQLLEISNAKFQFPETFATVLETQQGNQSVITANQNCFQSHMTTFKKNPYSLRDTNEVNSVVSGLTLYDCLGDPLSVKDLTHNQWIHVELPNIQPQNGYIPDLVLRKWSMNIHQFNVTAYNLKHALHLVIELVPVYQGRLFPITLLLSYEKPPTPEYFLFKFETNKAQNVIDIFLPAGSFNVTGKYFFGIVDATYNSGRLRLGEVASRNYTFKLWWGECLYWDVGMETWTPEGCRITQTSSFHVTKCECSHLTAFGGRFDLVPNDLSHKDVENFFSPNKNPVALTLISIVFILYFVLLLWCCHADQHDAQKGGVVYLLDNAPMDQQKYEITLETGIHSGAGTTAKISLILHGEEGMSETRELISEDSRPMFERNSRDKFILTLPDSIGKIWKVQIWHNNYGQSPSWYVSRIIVRDLNTGIPYFFICEKWLAVEEEDGKVEREFMVLEGTLDLRKALMSKTIELLADFHTLLSIATCPSYSGFKRTERLTLCLTILLIYMCLNAVWYKTSVAEYRGEFGLLDVSLRNVTVGAIICGVVIPVGLFIEFLFRRSKPKHASSVNCKDEVENWDHDYPSGKPNEQESEDTSEHVPPVMTYSLLDQSIMNWPNIQTWAQKQWMKRQQQSHMTSPGYHSDHSEESVGNIVKPTAAMVESPFNKQALSELDQASSGFEDCNSLIRPKASVDSTHTTAAPSVAESMRTHKPKSLPDSLRMSKPASELDSTKSSKAPSISSSGSHKSSVMNEKKDRRYKTLYLPYWCRYLAWSICGVLCVGCAVITALYGYRFGVTKSTQWLQSLFFSAMISVFISTPMLIFIAVVYAAIQYRRDPVTALEMYDIFNRVKAKQDLMKWKRSMELWFEGDALDRGVAARQRSRYLRFARPPQEKQLIEARKRVMKEKKALSVFRECVMFAISILLLLVMAYSKTTSQKYNLNTAIKTRLIAPQNSGFMQIKTQSDWYTWAESALLDSIKVFDTLNEPSKHQEIGYKESTYMIGSLQLRQQRMQLTRCRGNLPYMMMPCMGDEHSDDINAFRNISGVSYYNDYTGNLIFGHYGVYDGSGFIIALNKSELEAQKQIEDLKQNQWLDRRSRAVFVEFTLYNVPKNLFIAVDLLVEFPSVGVAAPTAKVTSTHVFRYTSQWDNVLLACELLFFLVVMLYIKRETWKLMDQRGRYFMLPWNILNLIICIFSVVFYVCYLYRFVFVSAIVEALRSTYYEKYVDLSFITLWDEILHWNVGILLFLSSVKSLRLLRYTKLFAIFGDVYRKARRELVLFFALFSIVQAGYACIGHVLFGSTIKSFYSVWSSLLAISALLTSNSDLDFSDRQGPRHQLSSNVFLFFFCVFTLGFLTCYMVAVLSHYFKSRKRRRLLAMSGKEAMLFYWDRLQLWVGLKKSEMEEEPEIILPPEFTMAEIEYQVDELLFRMNALSGSHGLPEKPACYLTDSDCTYGAGDDGISSGGSEQGQMYVDDRLEQRVQKIEDNLCSQEPFLAQLLKFDDVGLDLFSQEKEKQLRSHLELEIFRQLQIQRQDVRLPNATEQLTKNNDQGKITQDETNINKTTETPGSPGLDSTSSDEAKLLPPTEKCLKPKYTTSNITIQAIQDLLAKSAQEYKDFQNENSSSNPESPKDKITFPKIRKGNDNKVKVKPKQHNSSTSSSEKISPDMSLNPPHMYERDNIRKPTKPTFLHSRDSSLSDAQKNSPILKLRVGDKQLKPEQTYTGVERLIESSSGSEQDSFQAGRKLLGKRSLRKTKSRGKGKGADEDLGPGLVLDELDGEDAEFNQTFTVVGLQKELMDVYEERLKEFKNGGTEHTVRADVHHSSDSQ